MLPRQEAPATLHVAVIGQAIQVSTNEALLKEWVGPGREANATLSIVPSNARAAASLFLEYEGHCLALLNNQVWNCFYQVGVLAPDAAESLRKETARRFLGYVPVSPDSSTYRYDVHLAEVANGRHGSHRRPWLHRQVAETSELGRLLDQIKGLHAELRFLDNGLSTVLTIDRR